MSKHDVRREELVQKLADHLLSQGLQAASLRALANAACTSDRMLLHYFENKEEIITATLNVVNQRLLFMLESARGERLPQAALLSKLTSMLKDPIVKPYLQLWLELAARASRDEEPYLSISRTIGEGFLSWISTSLKVRRESERTSVAAHTLATLEGLVLLDSIGLKGAVGDALSSMEP